MAGSIIRVNTYEILIIQKPVLKIIDLQDGFFFITREPVEWFKIGDSWYDVIE